jgi:feruloyl esterase
METKTRNAKRSRVVAWACLFSSIGVATPFGLGPNERGVAAVPGGTTMPNCTVAALSGLNIPDVTITSASAVAASGLDPEYCDVLGSVATHGEGAGAGEARFQAKLPGNWNNKYLATGPGGVSGNFFPSTNPLDVASSLRKGYAFVTNDTGHQSDFFDASWALISAGVPNKPALADYFHRAQHQVAVATKELVTRFYGTGEIERSYFDGCSNAGRNALVEATRYPDDYDGIIAGAPHMDHRGNQIWGYKNAKAFLNAFIPAATLPAIDAAVKANCDDADGVLDGLIQNPAMCSFNPESLVPAILTETQADALKVFINAVRDDRGRLLYPGSSVSDLNDASGFGGFIPFTERIPPVDPTSAQPWGPAAPIAWQAADTIIRHFVVRDSSFNTNLDWPETDGVIDREAVKLFDKRTEIGDADRAEQLLPYFRRGKKVILYHGYDDQAISPYRTIWFYQDLAAILGGYRDVQKHARLFMMPGTQHCGGGPGPNSVDTLAALENWVERGIAPESIIASKYVNDNPSQRVTRTMPLCKFPEQARYDGVGDPNDAASWMCPSRDRSLLEIGPNGIQAGLNPRQREGKEADKRHDRDD